MSEDLNTLKPLERVDVADGVPLPDEVRKVVANRSGSILSASTILKSDFFSNLQKMSLPECVRYQFGKCVSAHVERLGGLRERRTSGGYRLLCGSCRHLLRARDRKDQTR